MNIDLHAHFLPKADHGSDGMTTSLTQISLAPAAEVDVLAATPHFYPSQDTVESFLRRREACFAALREQLPKQSPKLLLGAEVVLLEGLVLSHVSGGCYTLCAVPLNIAGCEGAPCRAVLIGEA